MGVQHSWPGFSRAARLGGLRLRGRSGPPLPPILTMGNRPSIALRHLEVSVRRRSGTQRSGGRPRRSAVVRWCGGAVVRRCGGAAVRRCGGAAVRRCGGAAVRRCGGAAVRRYHSGLRLDGLAPFLLHHLGCPGNPQNPWRMRHSESVSHPWLVSTRSGDLRTMRTVRSFCRVEGNYRSPRGKVFTASGPRFRRRRLRRGRRKLRGPGSANGGGTAPSWRRRRDWRSG
jgi:hypothetical protein